MPNQHLLEIGLANIRITRHKHGERRATRLLSSFLSGDIRIQNAHLRKQKTDGLLLLGISGEFHHIFTLFNNLLEVTDELMVVYAADFRVVQLVGVFSQSLDY